jgi:hypothetical protein
VHQTDATAAKSTFCNSGAFRPQHLGNNMTCIIEFTAPPRDRRTAVSTARTDNVVSMADWRSAPHPVRTPTGVFFITNVWGSSGDAA